MNSSTWTYRIAKWLPYWLRYAVVINAGVDSTTGDWSSVEVPSLRFIDVLNRMK